MLFVIRKMFLTSIHYIIKLDIIPLLNQILHEKQKEKAQADESRGDRCCRHASAKLIASSAINQSFYYSSLKLTTMTTTKKTTEKNVKEVNNAAAQAQAAAQPEMVGAYGEDYVASVKIAKVIAGSYENRVAFVIDGTPIAGFSENNEEAAVTTFGLNVNELCNQVRQQVPELAMFETAAMGKRINPQVVAFIFQGAEMQIERVYKEKGEQREATDDVYSTNCFVTKIKKVTTHINQMAQSLLQQMLMQSVQQAMQPVAANPFNIR